MAERDDVCGYEIQQISKWQKQKPRKQVIKYTNTVHTPRYGPGGGTPFREHMNEGTGTTTEGIINNKMAQREKLWLPPRRNNNNNRQAGYRSRRTVLLGGFDAAGKTIIQEDWISTRCHSRKENSAMTIIQKGIWATSSSTSRDIVHDGCCYSEISAMQIIRRQILSVLSSWWWDRREGYVLIGWKRIANEFFLVTRETKIIGSSGPG